MKTLESKLLGIGGKQVSWPFTGDESDLSRIYDKGLIFVPKRTERQLIRACPNHCHENAPLIANDFQDVEVWTGFSLGDDGMWRGHSWCVAPSDQKYFLETTGYSRMYYGARLPKKVWKSRVLKGKHLENFMQGWAFAEACNRDIRRYLKHEH